MKLSGEDLRQLTDLAISAADEAGKLIARSRPLEVEHKAAGESLASQVVTEIDRRSEDLILDILSPTLERFELGLLTEERVDDRSRLTADYFWSVDPLDGTLPFIEGSPGYAVSIALVRNDGTPVIGVIYDPVEASMLHAISGQGAFVDGRRWSVDAVSPRLVARDEVLSVFADRSFLTRVDYEATLDGLGQVARTLGLAGISLDTTAGAVMNASRVLANQPACYFKYPGPSGGGSLWDFAATACLFLEAGAVVTDIQGGPLDLNRADSTFMNHRGVLFATNEDLATQVQALGPDAS